VSISPSHRTTPLSISYETLSNYLAQSEATHYFKASGKGNTRVQDDEQVIIHKRKRTPEEDFDSADDAEVVERENRKVRRREERDGDWVGTV
jgi:hypothetical protein